MKFIKLDPVFCVKHGQATLHKMFSYNGEYIWECECGHIVKWAEGSSISKEEFLLNYKDQNSIGATPKRLAEKLGDTRARAAIKTRKWWEKVFGAVGY